MPGQGQEVAAGQAADVAAALGQAVVGAMALQGALAELPAAGTVGEAAWVVVIFEQGFRRYCRLQAGPGLQQQARVLEVVIAPRHTVWPGFQARLEAVDHRFVSHHGAVLHIGNRRL